MISIRTIFQKQWGETLFQKVCFKLKKDVAGAGFLVVPQCSM